MLSYHIGGLVGGPDVKRGKRVGSRTVTFYTGPGILNSLLDRPMKNRKSFDEI